LSGETPGTAQAFEENGLMLGAFSFATYTSVEKPFHEGMRALLYTDGILEMSNAAGEEFGIERLTQFAGNHEGAIAENFVEELFQHLTKWDDRHSGPDREDDLTVLAVQFAPKS
jgi:sigma-B regulation protein RsbU (phosphoserine phosphatase)